MAYYRVIELDDLSGRTDGLTHGIGTLKHPHIPLGFRAYTKEQATAIARHLNTGFEEGLAYALEKLSAQIANEKFPELNNDKDN